MESIGNVDSKYRFVILASKRAKQLLKGAKPKVKAKSRNLIRIAQAEVKSGLIDYELIPTHKEGIPEPDERVFVGADIGGDEVGESEGSIGKDLTEEEIAKDAGEVREEEEEEGGEAEGEFGDVLKEDKDE